MTHARCRHFTPRMTATLFTIALVHLLALPARAGGEDDYAARMAVEHAGDTPVAGAAAGDPGEEGVTATTVAYWPGNDVEGYLAVPAEGAPRAGVLVLQEWWGVNDNIRTMTRRLAAMGYAALAVDLYEGDVATDRDGAMTLMRRAQGNRERLEANLRAAHRHLSEELGLESIGSIGWCFGGGWSLQSAVLFGDALDAAVIYYGRTVADDTLGSVEAALLGHFGSEDGGIPIDGVHAFEAKATELGKNVTVHVYDGAHHAFANPSGTRYDETAAAAAWERTTAFFAEHLGGATR